jgi:hypothetical protein
MFVVASYNILIFKGKIIQFIAPIFCRKWPPLFALPYPLDVEFRAFRRGIKGSTRFGYGP